MFHDQCPTCELALSPGEPCDCRMDKLSPAEAAYHRHVAADVAAFDEMVAGYKKRKESQ